MMKMNDLMRRAYLFPLIAVFWASLAGIAGSLKCFTCSSDVKTNCGDPFYNVSVDMPSCGYDQGQGSCTKMVTTENVVVRGCGLKASCPDTSDDGCERTSSGATRCCCDADGCNSATQRTVDDLVLTAVLFAAIILNVGLQ